MQKSNNDGRDRMVEIATEEKNKEKRMKIIEMVSEHVLLQYEKYQHEL